MFWFKKKRIIGLALGSGGAKGSAHLGAITAMREEGIDFDVYSGTSIGSLIGALSAKGFSERDMLSILSDMMKNKAFALLSVLDGGLVGIIRSVLGGADFQDLKKPFSAVATDLYSGEEVVFYGGDLALAVASSCAMPPAFKPVNYGERKLIDGGFTNYVPANRCVEMGADVVISVNLSAERRTNEEGIKILDDGYSGHGVKFKDRGEGAYGYSSVVIEPKLSEYTGFSVNKIEEMFEAGYNATKEKMDEIKNAVKNGARFSKKDRALVKNDGAVRIV